jgi:hypothetical protein
MRDLRIDGLSVEEKEMLDYMWNNLVTEEDYETWIDSLDTRQQIMANSLSRMIIYEMMDAKVDEMSPDAMEVSREVLERYM